MGSGIHIKYSFKISPSSSRRKEKYCVIFQMLQVGNFSLRLIYFNRAKEASFRGHFSSKNSIKYPE
jgi:hypothetical protein